MNHQHSVFLSGDGVSTTKKAEYIKKMMIYIYQTLLSKATYIAFKLQFFTFYQLLLYLGIEPMTLALLVPCSTSWATGKLDAASRIWCFFQTFLMTLSAWILRSARWSVKNEIVLEGRRHSDTHFHTEWFLWKSQNSQSLLCGVQLSKTVFEQVNPI